MLIHYTEDNGRTKYCSGKNATNRKQMTNNKSKVTCSRCLKKFDEPVHYDLDKFILCSHRELKKEVRKTDEKTKVTCPKCRKLLTSKLMFTHYDNSGKPICSNSKSVDKRLKLVSTKKEVTCVKCKEKMASSFNGISLHNDKLQGWCLKLNRIAMLRLGRNKEDKINLMLVMQKEKMASTSCVFSSNSILTQFMTIKTLNYLRKSFIEIKELQGRNQLYVQDICDYFI